jgi:hypothetical protein
MKADRVVAWLRNQTRGHNLYDANEMMQKWNEVKSVNAEFKGHAEENRYFHTSWNSVLSKYLKKLPNGFTSNYSFEFFNGKCIMRTLCSLESPGLEATLASYPQRAGKAILKDLFGTDVLQNITMTRLCLPQHPGSVLNDKKLESLSKKYMSIPEKYIPFYPKEREVAAGVNAEEPAAAVVDPGFRKEKRGRKRNRDVCISNLNQESILSFLVPKATVDDKLLLDELIGNIVEVKFDEDMKVRLWKGSLRVRCEFISSVIKLPVMLEGIHLCCFMMLE